MPVPRRCPNPACVAHSAPPAGWRRRFGSYRTAAHGTVTRYRCRYCGTTCSNQTESLHFASKRHLSWPKLLAGILEGVSQCEIARRCRVSPMAVHSAIMRLGRRGPVAPTIRVAPPDLSARVVIEGVRRFVISREGRCDPVTLEDTAKERIPVGVR